MPGKYKLKEGDIVSVDCGAVKDGWYGDSAYTFAVGKISEEAKQLLRVTKEALIGGGSGSRRCPIGGYKRCGSATC
jgi:methionyl aminopeptidase